MKVYACVLLLVILIGVCDGFNRCDYPLIGWFSCKCELYDDYLDRLNYRLKMELYGQDEAIQILMSAFRLHRFNTYSRAPSTVHIAGDNGVGKTLTARIIGESIFKKKTSKGFFPEGILYIRGSTFNPDISNDPYRRDDMEKLIFNHLNDCESPIIIIDEVEELPIDMIGVFHPFLDDTISTYEYKGKRVNPGKAMFIFMSDFGTEGFTRDKSYDQLKEIIHKESLKFWRDPKQTAYIKHIIPYYHMNRGSAETFIKKKFQLLPYHYSFEKNNIVIYLASPIENIIEQATDFFLRKSKDMFYEYKNFRGLDQIFDEEILSEVLFQTQNRNKRITQNYDVHITFHQGNPLIKALKSQSPHKDL